MSSNDKRVNTSAARIELRTTLQGWLAGRHSSSGAVLTGSEWSTYPCSEILKYQIYFTITRRFLKSEILVHTIQLLSALYPCIHTVHTTQHTLGFVSVRVCDRTPNTNVATNLNNIFFSFLTETKSSATFNSQNAGIQHLKISLFPTPYIHLSHLLIPFIPPA